MQTNRWIGLWLTAGALWLLWLVGGIEARGQESKLAVAPTPSWRDVHWAYARIVANESGLPFSVADMDGILQSLLSPRNKAGKGLNRRLIMDRMVAHSPRTFPLDSPFLPQGEERRMAFGVGKQNEHQQWTSTLTRDCQMPSGWRLGPDEWRIVYEPQCRLLMRMAWRYLNGLEETKCDGVPNTWGSVADAKRRGGPVDKGWKEINCDHSEDCAALPYADRWSSRLCAKNTFWSWR